MNFLDTVVYYFTSQSTVATIVLIYSLIGILLYTLRVKKDKPRIQLQVLFGLFMLVTVAWSFLGASLVLCRAFLGLYQYDDLSAVKMVFGLALTSSVVVAISLSTVVTLKVPNVLSAKLTSELYEPEHSVVEMVRAMARRFDILRIRVLQSPSQLPYAYSIGGAVVISRGLVNELDDDEVESVISHEVAHIRNNDTRVNAVLAVYRRILFFDPLIRFIEDAVRAQDEFLADEVSARETRKPLALASALLKIHTAHASKKRLPALTGGLPILGRSSVSSRSNLRERVRRLLRIADELDGV